MDTPEDETPDMLPELRPPLAGPLEGVDAETSEASPSYGFGHRAHQPDPTATYTFEPGKPRTLPKDETRRWKVTG